MVTKKINKVILGHSLPATIYVLVYTLYTVTFSFHLGLNLIRLSYVVFYAMSVWYFFRSFGYWNKSSFIRALTMMFGLVMTYCAFLLLDRSPRLMHDITPLSYTLLYVASILPIYVFYYFGRRKMLTVVWFQIIAILFCLNAYALYYENQLAIMDKLLIDEGAIQTNNSGYIIVSLLPLIAFFNKRVSTQYVGIVLILISTIMCFKRGAVIIGVIAVTYYFYNMVKMPSTSRKLIVLVFGAASAVFLYMYLDNLFLTNDYFYQRVMLTYEGDSSGRDGLFGKIWVYILENESVVELLLGGGAAATVELFGIEAHNDWLEFAIDFGMLGIVLYVFYWVTSYKYFRYAKKRLPESIVMAMGMVLLMNFVRSFFSMSFIDMTFMSSSIIGYTMSCVDTFKHEGELIC